MIKDTLTLDNLIALKKSMDKIKAIDRSDAYKNYYQEIINRIHEANQRQIVIGEEYLNTLRKEEER